MQTEVEQLLARLPGAGIAEATRLGLSLMPCLGNEEWRRVVAHLTGLVRTSSGARQTLTAWLGDALVYGGARSRGLITECAAATGLDPGTLRNAKMVCSRIPLSCRHDSLSWSHHCEVGMVIADRGEIERWLTLAETEGLSTSALRRRVRLSAAAAGRAAPDRASDSSVAAFRLMRELRAVSRSIARERHAWLRWSPGAAELALDELRPIADFIDAVRARAMSGAAPAPRDPSSN